MRTSIGRKHFAALAVSAVLVAGLSAPVAAGSVSSIPFAGVFYGCAGTEGTAWVSGNVLHIRGFTNRNLWVTGNPLIDGFEDNEGLGNINLATGYGVGHPRSTVYPEAVDGTWEMQITVDISPTGLTAHGVGRGTGELQGMTLSFSSPGAVAVDPLDNPCSDLPFAAVVEGDILMPASAD